MTATGRRVFDSQTPTVLQPDAWTCAVSSATWCLRSIGIQVAEPDMRQLMIPHHVNEELGLLDGSGGQLARLFRNHFGLQATNQHTISFDEVAARAGRQPVAIGCHNWGGPNLGHWSAVRAFENGELVLANPGGTGPKFGQQRLDRAAFNQRGFFSAVWIDVDGVRDNTGGEGGDMGRGVGDVPPVAEIPFVGHGQFRVARTDGLGVRMRERPFADGGRRGNAPEGATVEGAEHAWRLVRTDGGVTGWVADTYLRAEGESFRVVDTDGIGVRVRAQPFPDGDRRGAAAEGALLVGIEREAYRQIRTADGLVGWATAQFLDRLAPTDADHRENLGDRQDSGLGGDLGGSMGEWTLALGAAISRENFWDPDGQPNRRAAMERFNQLSIERRRTIFLGAMEAGLTAEGITDPATREHWQQAMRSVVVGDGFPGECPDLNPFMLAGESGGVFRGGADRLNSSALGYFQFIAQKPIPNGQGFSPEFDYGHWRNSGPFPSDYSRQTEPVSQVRQFIRAIKNSRKHGGDPLSVVREKASGDHTWGP
jgi:hypothetical protein